MTMQERIKETCEQRGTTVTALERKLNFSNGALKKDGPIRSDRLWLVASELAVSMEYLVGATNNPAPIIPLEIEKWDSDKSSLSDRLRTLIAYYIAINGLTYKSEDILSLPIPEEEKDLLIHYRESDDLTRAMARKSLDIV